jgi:putative hemolysin
MPEDTLIWILFIACLGVSFLLSGMEAGVFALSRLRIRQQMRSGRKSARALHDYLENPENFLWTILVGNTLANLFLLGWLAVTLHRLLDPLRAWLVVAYAVVVFLFYTFFDLLPKTLFRQYPNRLCLVMVRPFRAIHWVLRPFVAVVESSSRLILHWRGGKSFTWRLFGNREELRLLMQESSQALSSDERAMINRVLDFQSQTVRQAMQTLPESVSINAGAPIQEALARCRETQLTRFPVWDDVSGVRRIVGLITLDTLLYQTDLEGKLVRDFLKPALYLDEDLRLELAMGRMQRSGQRLAIVLGRDRRELGIISLQDVLKVIFGEVSL